MTLLEPHPLLFSIADFPVTAHGAFFALGAIVAAFIFAQRLEVTGMRFVEGVEKAVLIVIFGLLGARFGYLVTYTGSWESVLQVLQIWQGGLVSFWGIAAGLLTAGFLARRLGGEPRKAFWRAVVIAGLVGWAIGRFGNYYIADSFGVLSPTWEVFYGRVPIQLFEAGWCLFLAFALRKHKEAAWLGIIGYLAGRMIIDMWRDEQLLGPFHVSQWLCLALLMVLLPFYVRSRSR